ncbi:MAG: coenzyme F420-0:L-glutamate ligase [Pseudomonadota bacterium]
MSYVSPTNLSIRALSGVPIVRKDDHLAQIIVQCAHDDGVPLESGDIIVLAQKIVSKAEGRQVALASIAPSDAAQALALKVDKDPRVVQLILDESSTVLRAVPGVLIVEHRLGLVMANAGIDMSNIEHEGEDDQALLLPIDPDRSARAIREAIAELSGANVGIVISDSVGRAWRECTVGLAIGVAGVPARIDLRGSHDLYGREQRVSEVALADSIAATAVLAMGECDEGRPIAVVRGLQLTLDDRASAKDVLRDPDKDLFR